MKGSALDELFMNIQPSQRQGGRSDGNAARPGVALSVLVGQTDHRGLPSTGTSGAAKCLRKNGRAYPPAVVRPRVVLPSPAYSATTVTAQR